MRLKNSHKMFAQHQVRVLNPSMSEAHLSVGYGPFKIPSLLAQLQSPDNCIRASAANFLREEVRDPETACLALKGGVFDSLYTQVTEISPQTESSMIAFYVDICTEFFVFNEAREKMQNPSFLTKVVSLVSDETRCVLARESALEFLSRFVSDHDGSTCCLSSNILDGILKVLREPSNSCMLKRSSLILLRDLLQTSSSVTSRAVFRSSLLPLLCVMFREHKTHSFIDEIYDVLIEACRDGDVSGFRDIYGTLFSMKEDTDAHFWELSAFLALETHFMERSYDNGLLTRALSIMSTRKRQNLHPFQFILNMSEDPHGAEQIRAMLQYSVTFSENLKCIKHGYVLIEKLA